MQNDERTGGRNTLTGGDPRHMGRGTGSRKASGVIIVEVRDQTRRVKRWPVVKKAPVRGRGP